MTAADAAAVRDLQRGAATMLAELAAADLPPAAWTIPALTQSVLWYYTRHGDPAPALIGRVETHAALEAWGRYYDRPILWPSGDYADPYIRMVGAVAVEVYVPRRQALAEAGGAS